MAGRWTYTGYCFNFCHVPYFAQRAFAGVKTGKPDGSFQPCFNTFYTPSLRVDSLLFTNARSKKAMRLLLHLKSYPPVADLV